MNEMTPQGLLDWWRRKFQTVVDSARLDGVEVTIEQRSLQPPRMGHLETVVSTRFAHGVYPAIVTHSEKK